MLPPYVEVVKLDRVRRRDGGLDDTVRALTKDHLARRPATNPMVRMQARLVADLPWLADQDLDVFHRYAFGTCRQCGANAELAATFADWLDAHDGGGLAPVAEHFRTIAMATKGLQLGLARAVRGRRFDPEASFAPMTSAWEDAMAGLVARYGG